MINGMASVQRIAHALALLNALETIQLTRPQGFGVEWIDGEDHGPHGREVGAYAFMADLVMVPGQSIAVAILAGAAALAAKDAS